MKQGTFRQAADYALRTHWQSTAWGAVAERYLATILPYFEAKRKSDLDSITTDNLLAFIADCRNAGNSTSTIRNKMSIIATVWKLARAHRPKPLAESRMPEISLAQMSSGKSEYRERWWLRPETVPGLIAHLRSIHQDVLADYILWTISTGLRVEENLRLHVKNFVALNDAKTASVHVPGTKTKRSQATLPLSPASRKVALELVRARATTDLVFPIHPKALQRKWDDYARVWLKEQKNPACTLRALRITYASTLHKSGMDIALIQRLMRHENMETTLGYLQLTGDETAETARRYLRTLRDVAPSKRVAPSRMAAEAGWGRSDVAKLLRRVA